MVAILLGKGFEPMEAVTPCDILRRGGVEVKFVTLGDICVEGGHGITVCADCTLDELDVSAVSMVVLPGGLGGVESILSCPKALELIRELYAQGKYVAAICAAPTILAALSITDGKKATCYPGMERKMGSAEMVNAGAVRDGMVITGRAAGSAEEFGLLLLQTLRGKQIADSVADGIVSGIR